MPHFQGFVEQGGQLTAKIHYPDARQFRLLPEGGAEIVPKPVTKFLPLDKVEATYSKLGQDDPNRHFYKTIMDEMGRRANPDAPKVTAPGIKPPTLSM